MCINLNYEYLRKNIKNSLNMTIFLNLYNVIEIYNT